MDYQPGGSSSTEDPLASQANCDRDIPYFQQLGVNTIRVYQVDNSADHDYCMKALETAGIYLILDVNTAMNSLNRLDAADSYNAVYLQHIFATVDAFKTYPNTMAFFAGNEVVNEDVNDPVGTWVKAVVRDLKQYITAQSSRYIPVGYSAADVSNSRVPLAEYLNCGDNSTRVDFYAFNSYSWCGASSYTESGYDQFVAAFSNYSAPLFFSEYGCNLVQPREFSEVASIYSTPMTTVFSGGLVYEYAQEVSDYGLVDVDGTSVEILPDFTNLMNAFAGTANPSGNGGYQTGLPASVCPANTSTFSGVWAENVLPAQPAGAAQYIKNGAGTPLGNTVSSQEYSADSVSNVTAGATTASSSSSSSSSSGSSSSGSSSSSTSSSTTTAKSGSVQSAVSFAPLGLSAILCLFGFLL